MDCGDVVKNIMENLKTVYLEKDNSLDDYKKEELPISKVLLGFCEKYKDQYEIVEPLGRGGSGIVIKLLDKQLQKEKALKIPRPKEKELLETFRSEINYLNKLRHENIIELHNAGEIQIDYLNENIMYPFFIMEFIKDTMDIKEKILVLVKQAKNEIDLGKESTPILKNIMDYIADKLLKIAQAIDYLHDQSIIHFDIKPSNIMLDEKDCPLLSDLGLAKAKLESNEKVNCGFTLFYSHPDLRVEYHEMSSKNRVRKDLSPLEFKTIWDIYAFGKSILEILALTDYNFPDLVGYNEVFVYLHLLGCRMLDGDNLSNDQYRVILQQHKEECPSIYRETWLQLTQHEFQEIKYKSIKEIVDDLTKIKNPNIVFQNIPELCESFVKRIQSSEGIPAPFSRRVKLIVEHPIFQRLLKVPQLGLLNTIYPSANHTRFEHSLGVFRNCVLYILSLYNDQNNPLFKQLTNEYDLKVLLLASLLHDIGHYPLGHDLEESMKDLNHENFTLKFLENSNKDRYGFTLKEIIENNHLGWGVKITDVQKLLKGQKKEETFFSEELKNKMLSSVIDGPIDVDKLDYLLRDSQNCFLKYGQIIDVDRLIRSLTIIITKDENLSNITFAVGTYEKGQSAAESLTFSRYLLYQALYWHHTARSIRSMLREALKYISSDSTSKPKAKIKNFVSNFSNFIGLEKDPLPLSVEDILSFISDNTDENGQEFIRLIRNRNYYKRIYTIHSEWPVVDSSKQLIDKFRACCQRPNFQELLQAEIERRFIQYLNLTHLPKMSLLAPSKTNKVLEYLSKPSQILCDAPESSTGTSSLLKFIPEPQRLQNNYASREKAGERVSEVWQKVHFSLMSIAAKGRVFCHPEIRDSIMAVLGPQGIKESIESTITSI